MWWLWNWKQTFSDIKWVSTLKYSQSQNILYSVGPVHSVEKAYLSFFLDDKFYEWVSQHTSKHDSYYQKGRSDSKGDSANVKAIHAMIYTCLTEAVWIHHYF